MDADLLRPVVVSTRGEPVDGPLSSAVRNAGGVLWSLPTTAADLSRDAVTALEARCSDPGRPDWIAITSPRAASIIGASHAVRSALTRTSRPRLAAVGRATADRLRRQALPVDLVSPRASGEALARALLTSGGCGAGRAGHASVVWPRSAQSAGVLGRALAAGGWRVDEYPVYRMRACVPAHFPNFIARLAAGSIDAVWVFAPSAVAGLAAALTTSRIALLGRTRLIAFGASTARAIEVLEWSVAATITSGDVTEMAGTMAGARRRDAERTTS